MKTIVSVKVRQKDGTSVSYEYEDIPVEKLASPELLREVLIDTFSEWDDEDCDDDDDEFEDDEDCDYQEGLDRLTETLEDLKASIQDYTERKGK